jgi:hydroxyacylglutathione hydrolase
MPWCYFAANRSSHFANEQFDMANLEIHQFPCLSDNYGVLLRDAAAGVVASIDAPDAEAVKAALTEKGWKLTHILVTHHHWDHTQGNDELKAATGCTIIGPRAEADKVPGIDTKVGEGDTFKFGNFDVEVQETPGHTAGHIIFHIPAANAAFVGDTLFAMGCGRVIEGNMEQMWRSVEKVAKLPPDTALYCGHEYTVANAEFAMSVEPDNPDLQKRTAEVKALRAAGKPTLPTTVAQELATNPFIRPESPEIRRRLNLVNASNADVFAEVRTRKNNF